MTLLSFIMLGVGIVIGVALRHIFTPKNNASTVQLEEQLTTLKKDHEDYQQQVSLHFQQSANMIHEMNERQQQISLHLSKGLDDLIDEQHRIAPDDAESESPEKTELLELDPHSDIQAPVDYQK